MKPAAIAALRRTLLRWYARHGRDLPWRRTSDAYSILVSEFMLQQTQVERVVPKYEAFLERFPTIRALARARLGDVLRVWVGLGYNARARRIWECARIIDRNFGGRVPSDEAALRALPGIGRYTAAAVACFAFDYPSIAVDTNVRRVLSRAVAGVDDAGERAAWELASAAAPLRRSRDFTQALMDIGALHCRSIPQCASCPIRNQCRGRAKSPSFARHATRAAQPFVGSRRWYRGRVVQALATSRSTRFAALGEQVKAGFQTTDLPWLTELLGELRRDGLIEVDEKKHRARLP